jgi:hypothetical protein
LPNLNEPENKPKHISAVVSTQAKTKKIVQSKTVGNFESSELTEKRNELQFQPIQSEQSIATDSNNNNLKRQVSSVDAVLSAGQSNKQYKEKQRISSTREEISAKSNQNFENHIESIQSTKLVPIQKFSFFKWQINVDTLVRIFIIA